VDSIRIIQAACMTPGQNWPSVVSIDMHHRILFYIEWRVAASVVNLSLS